jgi:oxygen-independent coproporphyrinogen-3 oxidase
MIFAICQEITIRHSYLKNQLINTIYFGGGTPSILTKEELEEIMNAIKLNFVIANDAEITFEANPDDIIEKKLGEWKSIGINRLSIGLQSFKAFDLKWMNRAHTADESEQCVKLAKKHGFNNLTVDLMYGLPNLTNEEWEEHLLKVVQLGVPHISAYCLTVEEQTVLHHKINKGEIKATSEDVQSDQFMLMLKVLKEQGYQQYEISNFSKVGHESIHNSNYWKGESYLGIGPSAHSFNGKSRSWNISNNSKYIEKIERGEDSFEEEILSQENRFNELVMTGLRTVYGVSLAKLTDIQPLSEAFLAKSNQFIAEGLLELNNGILTTTENGRLQADYLASELFVLS